MRTIAMGTKLSTGLRRQRGVVLFIALIVLVAMTLASIALVRSVDTATIGAGNLAFKQSAAQAAERSVALAFAAFDPGASPPGFFTTVANTQADQTNYNYRATMLPTDSRGIPNVLLDVATFDSTFTNTANKITVPTTGETLRFVVDRLCTQTGPADELYCNVDAVLPTGGTAGSQPLGSTVALYRITVRADGPRNTQHFTQVIFRP
jgi:type IV pilus assembly protein PilX